MEFSTSIDLPVSADHCFGVLRHFHRAYPRMHAAHLPISAGINPGLLQPGYTFAVEESFGRERRYYNFSVEQYEPTSHHICLQGRSITRSWPFVVRGEIEVDLRVTPLSTGCQLVITQRVRFVNALLNLLLNHAWLWPGVARHAQAETHHTAAFMLDPEFSPTELVLPTS
jgi:hypothetical protein